MTADAIGTAQHSIGSALVETVLLPSLREQDFGSSECQPWNSRASLQPNGRAWPVAGDPGFVAKETYESMAVRTNAFLDASLLPLLDLEREASQTVAIVSHGITLSVLWRNLLRRFSPQSVSLGPGLGNSPDLQRIEHLPAWSNTAYLELEITPLLGSVEASPSIASRLECDTNEVSQAESTPLQRWGMTVRTINGRDHLKDLKRTRGGVGSSRHDERQRKIEGFFTRQRPEQ